MTVTEQDGDARCNCCPWGPPRRWVPGTLMRRCFCDLGGWRGAPGVWTSEHSSGMHGGFRTTLLMACLKRAPSSGLGHWTVSGRGMRGFVQTSHPARTRSSEPAADRNRRRWTEERPACCRLPHSLYFTAIHRQPSVSPTGAACRQQLDPQRTEWAGLGWGLLQVQAEGEASLRQIGPNPVQPAVAFHPRERAQLSPRHHRYT